MSCKSTLLPESPQDREHTISRGGRKPSSPRPTHERGRQERAEFLLHYVLFHALRDCESYSHKYPQIYTLKGTTRQDEGDKEVNQVLISSVSLLTEE